MNPGTRSRPNRPNTVIRDNIQAGSSSRLQHVIVSAACRALAARGIKAETVNRPLFWIVIVFALYVLHQDVWFWHSARPLFAGFLPVGGGTVVAYAAHAFTDQVAGFGGSMKRSIGRRVMADQMKKMFEAGRKEVK